MPLSREEKIELIRAYEPILYFHPDEEFVPVKPEVYMEASALWCSQPPSHDKEDWTCDPDDRAAFPYEPLIPKNGISVNPAHDFEGSDDPDGDGVNEWYLGHQNPDGFLPYLVSNEERELWLNMAGWQGGDAVTADSENKSCNVERVRERWSTEDRLVSAGDWYYAEVEDLDTLSDILAIIREEDGPDLGQLLRDILGEVWFIWYYFLYPVHQADMRGCEETIGAGEHGNYEGDWNAVGVIVRRPATLPWEGGEFPHPEYIGFGRRARGQIEDFVGFLRQQMNVHNWVGGEVRRVGRHPKVYVAQGSHNNYSNTGPKRPPEIALGEATCGATDAVDEAVSERLDDLEDTLDTIRDILVTVAKVGAGCAIGGPLGCAIGGIAAAIEAASSGSDDDSTSTDDDIAEVVEDDHPPDEGNYGLVLSPQDLVGSLPDASDASEVRPWKGDPDTHLVDRELQIWWPGRGRDPGYNGRWGVMCQDDRFDRRSGIKFPNFKRAFLLDLAADLSR